MRLSIVRFIFAACAALFCAMGAWPERASSADQYDAAVAHGGRSAGDLKRDGIDHPAEVLRLSGIQPGMRVADIVGGSGYYSEILSYLVGPKGKVLLINNEAADRWSTELRDRLSDDRLRNVVHETLDLDHMRLKPASIDAVLFIKVYHELYWIDPTRAWPKIKVSLVLDQISSALKPGGILLIEDHSAQPGSGVTEVNALHRIDEEYVTREIESHGFKVIERSDLLRRPDDPRKQLTYEGPMLGKTDRFVLVCRKQ